MRLARRFVRAVRMARPAALRLSFTPCPFCGMRPIVKLDENEHAVRCPRCGANPVAMSVQAVIGRLLPDLAGREVYELASRGPLSDYLRRAGAHLTASEYLDGVEPGAWQDGVQCQDVQCLTYPDAAFDACIATDVFEHVPDDRRGFAELHRVLKKGGILFLTVPLHARDETVERARIEGNTVEHLLPPEYHDDPLRGPGTALVFREYGHDIPARLLGSGFAHAEIIPAPAGRWWGMGRPVIVARKE